MAEPAARIVFIGGYARTGSTLLDRLLGQVEGFASFGELRHVWDRNFQGNQLCGCGRPFRECPFWCEVVEEAFGGFDGIDPVAVGRDKGRVDSVWNIPRMAWGGWTARSGPAYARYTQAVGSLYSAVQRVSGARWLVDSTKDPQHAYVLRSIEGFDVRMVHLVRDSRAVAYSWRRVRRRPEITWREQDMPRFPIVRSALAWDVANMAAAATRRLGMPYVFVRYEDLVGDPRRELQRIIDTLDLDGAADLGFLRGRTARLGPAHTVAGNPVRFREGDLEIRPDVEWASRMPAPARAVVTSLTWPLLRGYGYGVGRKATVAPEGIAGRRRVRRPGPSGREMLHVLRLAVASRREPLAYAGAVAGLTVRYLEARGVPLAGRRWLDVGTGGGAMPEALRAAGARVVALDVSDRRLPDASTASFVMGSGERLPFATGAFDGVLSSNVLEHAPDTWGMVGELLRVCRPGGCVYLSWTNWYSPLGGHEWSPFHYLGPRLGPRAYRAVRGKAPPWNVPGRTLFPVHVGPVLRGLAGADAEVVDVVPRYWPSLRFLARVPGLREVAMWNCVVLMRKPRARR